MRPTSTAAGTLFPKSLLRLLQCLCFLPWGLRETSVLESIPTAQPRPAHPMAACERHPSLGLSLPLCKRGQQQHLPYGVVRTQWLIQVEAFVSRKDSMIGQGYSHTEERTLEAQPTEEAVHLSVLGSPGR